MVLRNHALAFSGGEHWGAEPLGELYELCRSTAPIDAEASDQDWPPGLAEDVERRLEICAVRSWHDPIRPERWFGGVVTSLAHRLALRELEMHRAWRHRR